MVNIAPCTKENLVWIIWKDACGDSARLQVDSVESCSLVTNTNVGWILHENEERVILAHGISTGGEVDFFAIPSNCVVERIYPFRKEVKNGRKKAKRRK